ncbi:MAG: Hsp20/alpha crystallin family protein [Acidobacteriota bacterium]|jgi:HSP20 family protein
MNRALAGWELAALARQLDELLALLASPPEQRAAAWTPPVDLIELPDRLAVRIDVPGVTRGDLRLTLTRNRLRLAGRRFATADRQAAAHCHRAERNHGGFFLEIRLPPGIIREQVTARLEAGVLEIILPRGDEDREVVTVPIREEEP